MAHSRWTEVEARAAIKAWKTSGLRATEFARQRGISPQRLYWWMKKVGPDDEDVSLVRVRVNEPTRGEPVLVLLRSGHMLKVGRSFDEEAFSRAISVLEGC